MAEERNVKIGRVVSHKMDKTAVVQVEMRRRVPIYKRVVTHRAKFKVHDPNNACKVDDRVRIVPSRAFSKTKHWRLLEILAPAAAASGQEKQP